MPITAFSRASGDELDVAQVLQRLAGPTATEVGGIDLDAIPDSWREVVRTDMECPCCFVLGAELVRQATSRGASRRVLRQAYFRFSAHLPHCDYSHDLDAGVTGPENLVSLSSDRSALTTAIRQLVCAGLETGAFSQRTVRDMREWFFREKVTSSFVVTLNPELAMWLKKLLPQVGGTHARSVPALTRELTMLPGFDWREAARWVLNQRYKGQLDRLKSMDRHPWHELERISYLAKRYHGALAFDPSSLEEQYKRTTDFGWFIAENYSPIGKHVRRAGPWEQKPVVLAFAALLLFIAEWSVDKAAALFGRIAAAVPASSQTLGNVIGLNPWHDFAAWRGLRQLQELQLDGPLGHDSPEEEASEIERGLRQAYR